MCDSSWVRQKSRIPLFGIGQSHFVLSGFDRAGNDQGEREGEQKVRSERATDSSHCLQVNERKR